MCQAKLVPDMDQVKSLSDIAMTKIEAIVGSGGVSDDISREREALMYSDTDSTNL